MLRKLITALFFVTAAPLLLMAEEGPAGKNNLVPAKGLINVGEGYQIFPEGKMGNNLYKRNKKIFSKPDLLVKGVLEVDGGVLVYALNKQEMPVLDKAELDKAQISNLGEGFFRMVNEGKKSLFHVSPEGKIVNLLPYSGTPDGMAINSKGWGAFSHITGGETVEIDGKKVYLYSYKVHIVKKDQQVRHWASQYRSEDLPLRLAWSKPDEVTIYAYGGEPVKVRVD